MALAPKRKAACFRGLAFACQTRVFADPRREEYVASGTLLPARLSVSFQSMAFRDRATASNLSLNLFSQARLPVVKKWDGIPGRQCISDTVVHTSMHWAAPPLALSLQRHIDILALKKGNLSRS